MQLINGIGALRDTTRMIICDLWGVMHDGIKAHAPAINAIEQARRVGITTVFLSNAPRPRDHVRGMLHEMGVPKLLTNHIVTSGGLARDTVRERFNGARLYHMGPPTDHNTVDGLPVSLCDTIDNADVILATGLDFPDVKSHRAMLEKAYARGITLLCANPDRIVHVGDKLFTCAGAVADLYAEMGGSVEWFGKPMASALLSCMAECGIDAHSLKTDQVIMVGDSLQTDIAGANNAGIKSLFIAGGIHREDWPAVVARASNGALPTKDFHDVFGSKKPTPDYISETFRW